MPPAIHVAAPARKKNRRCGMLVSRLLRSTHQAVTVHLMTIRPGNPPVPGAPNELYPAAQNVSRAISVPQDQVVAIARSPRPITASSNRARCYLAIQSRSRQSQSNPPRAFGTWDAGHEASGISRGACPFEIAPNPVRAREFERDRPRLSWLPAWARAIDSAA